MKPLTFTGFCELLELAETKPKLAARRLVRATKALPRAAPLAPILVQLTNAARMDPAHVLRFEKEGAPILMTLDSPAGQCVWLAPRRWKKRLIPRAPRLSLLGLHRLGMAMVAELKQSKRRKR